MTDEWLRSVLFSSRLNTTATHNSTSDSNTSAAGRQMPPSQHVRRMLCVNRSFHIYNQQAELRIPRLFTMIFVPHGCSFNPSTLTPGVLYLQFLPSQSIHLDSGVFSSQLSSLLLYINLMFPPRQHNPLSTTNFHMVLLTSEQVINTQQLPLQRTRIPEPNQPTLIHPPRQT